MARKPAVVALATFASLTAALLLTSCAQESTCHTGADSPTLAVKELLAASTTMDTDRACIVVEVMAEDTLQSNLAEISEFVSSAGGVTSLHISDLVDEQMGSEHVIKVAVKDSTAAVTFSVIQNGGKYRVIVDDTPHPTDEETTNPFPRPASDPIQEREA